MERGRETEMERERESADVPLSPEIDIQYLPPSKPFSHVYHFPPSIFPPQPSGVAHTETPSLLWESGSWKEEMVPRAPHTGAQQGGGEEGLGVYDIIRKGQALKSFFSLSLVCPFLFQIGRAHV